MEFKTTMPFTIDGVAIRIVDVHSGVKGGVIGPKQHVFPHKTFADWVKIPGHIYCGRAVFHVTTLSSPYRNPFNLKQHPDAIDKFKKHMIKEKLAERLETEIRETIQKHRELKTIELGCWCVCSGIETCHVQVLLEGIVSNNSSK